MASSGAGGEPSRSAIVADTASGHHLLTIQGYSCTKDLPTGEKISSRPFTVGGHRWRIDYYPNGVSSSANSCISLSLVLDEKVAADVKAKYSFCLAGEVEEKQAARLASATSSKNLKNDSFTVRCDIVVVHRYLVEDAPPGFVSVPPPCDLRRDLAKLLETEKGADVVFEVGGETLAAHRCVLAARSSVFAAELFGPIKEGNAAAAGSLVVPVEDMEAEVFKALLRYAYTGSLPQIRKEDEDATCQHLLTVADRYGMERLKLICEEKLCKYINVGTAVTILVLAEQHHCEGLKKACFKFLATPANLKAVVATDALQQLSTSCPSLMVELMAMSLAHS
ncbi:unnamed protein product [Triticum turgidum subsp. durum]|uniref:Uncharacterized protein n=1 Tax=Triticum turgidum subsp. durum TaxID=4567 RepID=A0A9R0YVA0_TRITD|nr:unnamed protein product [Triticum turgidum subsp. durum]